MLTFDVRSSLITILKQFRKRIVRTCIDCLTSRSVMEIESIVNSTRRPVREHLVISWPEKSAPRISIIDLPFRSSDGIGTDISSVDLLDPFRRHFQTSPDECLVAFSFIGNKIVFLDSRGDSDCDGNMKINPPQIPAPIHPIYA